MAKYDCTKAKDFLHELKRASEWCRKMSASECKECEMIRRGSSCFLGFARNLDNISENQFDYVIEKTQKWSDGHPEPPKRELTEDERNILKAFKILGFTYIAADSNGYVWAYISKPLKGERMWCNVSANYASDVCKIEKFFGGIVSWKDEEPAKIEDLLKEVEQK